MFLKLTKKGSCRMHVLQLEELVSEDASLAASEDAQSRANGALLLHLQKCARCRDAVEAAKLTRKLLRETREPQGDPGPMFASRVLARIRAQELSLRSEFEFWNPIEIFAKRVAWASSVLLLVLSSALYQTKVFHMVPPDQEAITDRFPDLVPEQPLNNDEALVSLAEKAHE